MYWQLNHNIQPQSKYFQYTYLAQSIIPKKADHLQFQFLEKKKRYKE